MKKLILLSFLLILFQCKTLAKEKASNFTPEELTFKAVSIQKDIQTLYQGKRRLSVKDPNNYEFVRVDVEITNHSDKDLLVDLLSATMHYKLPIEDGEKMETAKNVEIHFATSGERFLGGFKSIANDFILTKFYVQKHNMETRSITFLLSKKAKLVKIHFPFNYDAMVPLE